MSVFCGFKEAVQQEVRDVMVVAELVQRDGPLRVASLKPVQTIGLQPHDKSACDCAVDWSRALDACAVLQTVEDDAKRFVVDLDYKGPQSRRKLEQLLRYKYKG